MPETKSAQPLTLFQSPVMAALERLLSQLTRRVAGPQSQFGSRNLSFVERILSRRLDSLGFAPTADKTTSERAVPPQSWLLPKSWVPSPAELLRSEQPEEPAARLPAGSPAAAPLSVGAAQRRPVVVPLPAPAARQGAPAAPAMPLPIPDELPAAAPRPAVARPAAGRPVETPAPAVARTATPAAAPAALSVPASLASPPSLPADEVLLPAAAPLPLPETASAEAPSAVETPAASAAAIASSPSSQPAVEPSPATPSQAAAPLASAVPAASAAAPETRVRDWLAQWSSPAAAPAGRAPSLSAAAPSAPSPGPSAFARSFNHLGWADSQLTRSPSQRLAAAPSTPLVEPAARPAPALAMPMVSTPELVPPTKQPLSAAPLIAAARPAQPADEARRVPAAAVQRPAAAPTAPTALPAAMAPVLTQLAAAPQVAEAQPGAPSATSRPAALPAPLGASAPPVTRQPAVAAPARGQAQPSLEPASNVGLDLGLLARPLFAGLSSTQAGLGAALAPAQPGAWLPPAWSEPGALASRFDGFATAHRSLVAAAAPSAGPSGLREWAAAPGVPSSLSRALHREDSYTPARWQRAEAALPYLPAPSAPTAPTAEPAPQAAARGLASAPAARVAAGSAAAAPLLRAPSLAAAPSPIAAPGQLATPQPGRSEPAQPWRAIGGAATLAEMFAAGIGLGSGSIATLAQTSAPASGGLIADWLQPLLRAGSGDGSTGATSLGAGLLSFADPEERLPAEGAAAPSPLSVQTPGRRPIGAAGERPLPLLSRAAAEPATSGRWVPTASGLVWVAPEQASPTAAQTSGPALAARAASPETRGAPSQAAAAAAPIGGAGWSQMGALGLRTEQLAAMQGVRVAGAPLASPTAAAQRQDWVGAPGISDVIARALGRDESRAPARWQQLGSQLPFVSMPSPAPEDERAPVARPAAAPQPQPVAAMAAPQGRRPWLELGGTAALAELFAAGVGLGSGSAGLLAEASPERKPGLVADWLHSLLSAAEPVASGPGAAVERRSPITASMLPYLGLEAAPSRERAAVVQQRPAGERSVERAAPLSPTRAWPRAGGLSVGAEQFATSHGLGGAAGSASRSEAGQWVPIAGGMVFVPREERPEETPAAAGARPQPATAWAMPALSVVGESWSRAGAMGLRTELFASQQVASKQPGGMVGQLALPEQDRGAEAPAEGQASPRWGWSGGGGLIYLGPAPGPSAATQEGSFGAQPSRPSIFDLARAGFDAPQSQGPGRAGLGGEQRQPLGLSWVAPSVAAAAQGGEAHESEQAPHEAEQTVSRRAWSGGLPVLSLPPESAGRAAGQQPVAPSKPTVPSTQELGARFAAPMLTSFPRQEAAGQAPLSLWPQTTLATTERLSRVLSMLPTGWQPTPAVVTAMSEAGAPGMPLWQKIPTPAAMPVPMPKMRVQPSADPTDDDDAEEPLQSRADMPMVSARPGAAQRQQQQQQQRQAVAAAPSQPAARRAPDTQMITAALEASGASKAQVEASVKLMQAIRSHATSGVAKSDDRLSLDDLHMIAISMGQGRMAASQSPIANAVGSVDAALRLPPALHPKAAEDTPTINKKIKHLSDMVVKQIESTMKNQAIRGGHGG